MSTLEEYYNRRAREHEEIYRRDDPVPGQAEQAAIAEAMQAALAGRNVLELACGTGYWTERAVKTAAHITAMDSSLEMLAIAGAKNLPNDKVDFQPGDAYHLASTEGEFDGGLAMFWLSHVPKVRLGGSCVVFIAHSVLVPLSSWPTMSMSRALGVNWSLRRVERNTFKLRQLSDGSEHMVLKNYYDEKGLRGRLGPGAPILILTFGSCFWWVSYTVDKDLKAACFRITAPPIVYNRVA